MNEPELSLLSFMAPISVSGADAGSYLQGQLSCDLSRLATGFGQIASVNSPQGRVQAVVTLIARAEDVLLFAPAVMAETLILRLRKYVMRSKVTLTDLRGTLRIRTGTRSAILRAGLECPPTSGGFIEAADGSGVLCWHRTGPDAAERFLVLAPAHESKGEAPATDASDAWRLADIRDGLPQVLPETRESFIAQMLNLDLVGGISFEKGCYTGQEIIARAHFRGTVKRRMFRFGANCEPPAPGTRLLVEGSHAGDVVDAAAVEDGCEFLAVVSIAQKDAQLVLESNPGVPLAGLPLPYDVA